LLYSLILSLTLVSGTGAIDYENPTYQLAGEVGRDTMLAIFNRLQMDIETRGKPELWREYTEVDIGERIVSGCSVVRVRSSRSVIPVIYDAAGRKVKELARLDASITPQKILLDATDIPAGIYWLGIPGSKGVVYRRFVVVR